MADLDLVTKTLKMPVDCVTDLDKKEWCLCAWEKLRMVHNGLAPGPGKDYRDGIINLDQFRVWQNGEFEDKQKALLDIVNTVRKSRNEHNLDIDNPTDAEKETQVKADEAGMRQSKRWAIDLDTDIVDRQIDMVSR